MSIFDGPPGSTPLDPDEQEALIPTWIATRGDLDRAEQENIASATVWVRGRRWKTSDITSAWLRALHRRMLDRVWEWAGSYRRRDMNIGVRWFEVPESVEALVLDVREQIGVWPADELAVRFHHRLVSIHPFVNGNGRHARLAADVLVETLGGVRFSWGAGGSLVDEGEARRTYLAALRLADQQANYDPLISFARSATWTHKGQ